MPYTLPGPADPTPAPPEPSPSPEPDLLEATHAGPADRVLLLGANRIDLLCAAVRRGCRTVTTMVAPPRCPEPADLIVAPDVVSAGEAAAVLHTAWRALSGGTADGRLAMALRGAAATLAPSWLARLAEFGFVNGRVLPLARGGVLLLGDFARPEAMH